MEYQITLQIHA